MTAQVLLIDDYPEFSDSLKRSFELDGIQLDLASTWEEGVSKFRVGLHELVIADYNLPDSPNGLKLLARIRQICPSSELILISGAITSVPAEKIKIPEIMDDYFPKNSELDSILLERAKEAEKRSRNHTQWVNVAKAHVIFRQIEEEKIEQLDRLLRTAI